MDGQKYAAFKIWLAENVSQLTAEQAKEASRILAEPEPALESPAIPASGPDLVRGSPPPAHP
jgi:hypothetical protein